jgi:hypothetical protein
VLLVVAQELLPVLLLPQDQLPLPHQEPHLPPDPLLPQEVLLLAVPHLLPHREPLLLAVPPPPPHPEPHLLQDPVHLLKPTITI